MEKLRKNHTLEPDVHRNEGPGEMQILVEFGHPAQVHLFGHAIVEPARGTQSLH